MLFRSPAWDEVTYWALDLETGGLDARRDPVLAIGMVPVRNGTVRIGEGYRTLVRPGEAAIDPASVPAHQLLRAEVQDAPALEEVLPEVERRLRGAVLLVHYQAIDVAFLRRDFGRAGLRWPAPKVVDTARLLVRWGRLSRPDLASDQIERNLSRARRAHGLPDYEAHDALVDAIACAELFLVLRKIMGAGKLRDLL
jgi:DNA polymerase-3 subunit epsilon